MSPRAPIQPTRRHVCALGAGAALGAMIDTAFANGDAIRPPDAERPSAGLGAIAQTKGILFGASFAVHELDTAYGPQYAAIYKDDARILTSELEFKMAWFRPSADKLDFAGADRLIDFAGQNGLPVRAHTLIWNDYLPDWIKQLPVDEMRQLMDMHLSSVIGRYREKVAFWDVVNEPIGPWDRKPGNLRNGPYYAAFGEDYITHAFKAARALAPAAKLVLNEAQTETADETGATFRKSLLELLKRLNATGAPIDAICLQSHLRLAAKYDLPAFEGFLSEIAARGYEIHITELDVNDAGFAGPVTARDQAVADLYESYLGAVLKNPAVKVVETWQLCDRTSWMQEAETKRSLKFTGDPRPLLYDSEFRKKPSWHAVARALEAAPAR